MLRTSKSVNGIRTPFYAPPVPLTISRALYMQLGRYLAM